MCLYSRREKLTEIIIEHVFEKSVSLTNNAPD